MTWKAVLGLVIIGGLSATLLPAQSALETYQRALVEEQAAGNLNKAIELYEKAAREAGSDRPLAARALIRAAASYRKLRQPKAAELYEQVVRTYPEQREQVTNAQQQLAELRLAVQVNRASMDVSSVAGPMLETYCIACHNQTRRVGGLALDTIETKNVGENPEVWEKVLRRLRARTEPPYGLPRPQEDTYQSVITSIELALDRAYPVNTPLNSGDRASDIELAARLAKFLWNGAPDERLLNAARRNTLKDPAVLETEVRRMLRDPRSESLAINFFARWLQVSDLSSPLIDQVIADAGFPEFDETMRASFRRETELFVLDQLRDPNKDRSAIELLTANYTFVNERLARHYGLPNVSGNQFRRVMLNDNNRAGLLGHGSILTLTSVITRGRQGWRTSPTLRGKWVLQVLLGVAPPPPPPNTDPLPEDSRPVRHRLTEVTANPRCATCHRIFDPLGLALDNFDGFGQWRNTEAGAPVDASGVFADGTRFNSPAEFRAGLLKYRDAFLSNLTEQLLAQALGRTGRASARIYPYEMPAVRAILREAAARDYSWTSLITGIARSTPFQMKTLVP